jgi:hypothetical protein
MINIYDKFKENKLTLITTGFSVFTFLKDVEDVITHFFESLKYFFIAFFIMGFVLIYNFFKYNKTKQINNINKDDNKVYKKNIFNSYNDKLEKVPKKNNFNLLNKLWIKIAIIFCTGFIVIGLLSISYVKNYPIYYVKVKDFKNEKDAIEYMYKLNNQLTANKEFKIRARCLIKSINVDKYPNGNYMIALNGGHISKEKALVVAQRAKQILGPKINLTVPNPSRNISVKKKIIYLMENNY